VRPLIPILVSLTSSFSSYIADHDIEGQQAKVTGADRAEDVFGVNYRKLQRIKAKYEYVVSRDP
jgi:hypothetical protein